MAQGSTFTAALPQEGLLPLFILLVGATSIANAVQCYCTMSYTRRLYPGRASPGQAVASPATPLSSRTFGTWTFAVGLVRMFAAYHIREASWYQMQMLTYVVGLGHFGMEAWVYRTTPPSGPWLAPVSVALTGLVWSLLQYDFYVSA